MTTPQRASSGERERIDVEQWERRALLELFGSFDEPYHGVCVDCTDTFRLARQERLSVFLALVHRSLVAAHRVENFRIRIEDGNVWR